MKAIIMALCMTMLAGVSVSTWAAPAKCTEAGAACTCDSTGKSGTCEARKPHGFKCKCEAPPAQ